MNRSVSISSSDSGRGHKADSQVNPSLSAGTARQVNLTLNRGRAEAVGGGPGRLSSQKFEHSNVSPLLASQIVSSPALGKPCAPASSSTMTTPHRQEGLTLNSSAGRDQRGGNPLSFSRVQAAGGAQGSLGKEPDYWSYTPPSPPSAAHRAFSSCSKYDMQSEYLKAASLSGSGRAGMTGNVDRMLSTSHSSADKKAGPPVSASVRQEEADLNDGREPEEEEQPQDDAEWQEYEGETEQRDCTDGLAEAVWDKRIPQTSTQYPICSRTPRERCAYTTSDDWAIFALHNQYVRPLRDREWVAGEPCIIRKNSFELPPGAYRYSESTCGIPATAFDRFVFPNPPRQFLMAARGRSSGNVDFAPPSSYFRMGTQRSGTRGRRPQLTQQQLLDLERMLWFDPEPRLERPFRLYADSKTCLKGRLHDIGHIMRSGW